MSIRLDDARVRAAAFAFLVEATSRYSEVLPWRVLLQGFELDGIRIPLLSQQGIFKPSVLESEPLSIRTAPPDERKPRPYDDDMRQDGVHQRTFAKRVLNAYRTRCAVCRLRRRELLDAAHILPDGHPLGEPIVPNGIALCKLHHAAFDSDILGIRPDLLIEVRRDVLEEVDGPMTIEQRSGTIGTDGDPADAPDRAPKCAIVRGPMTESSGEYDLSGVVETALARALVLAAEAKRWDVVAQIAEELARRGSAQPGLARSSRLQRSSTR